MSGGGSGFQLHSCRRPKQPRPKSIHVPDPAITSNDGEGGVNYTTLSDLIPVSPSVSPPSRASVGSSDTSESRIKNRLAKQAAYAYLQSLPSSTESIPCRRRRRCSAIRWCLVTVGSCFGFMGLFLRRIRIR